MKLPSEMYFSVAPENRIAAVAHMIARGFPPLRIEHSENGLVVLVLPSVSEERMFELAQALPIHLSAKVAYVIGDEPPFIPADRSIR